MAKLKRGFASMSADRVRQVASKGGQKTANSHDMALIGKAGGEVTAKRGSSYFARIGRLGGKAGKRRKATTGVKPAMAKATAKPKTA